MHLDMGNRLHAVGAERFTYDDCKHLGTHTWMDGVVTCYHHDSENQLVRVDDAHEEPWTATYGLNSCLSGSQMAAGGKG